MPKARKKNLGAKVKEVASTESSNNIEAPELQPISVWAQQIKEKLGKASYQDQVIDDMSQTLPSPLAAIVQQNTVARMARVLKEKMRAFSTANTTDPLVTTCVDSSEVTFPSPVPPLGTILAKPLPEDIATPVLTLREKFGHTYQRSYPPPKKRKLDSDDEEEESTSGISLWLDNEMKEAAKKRADVSNNVTEDKKLMAEANLKITNSTEVTKEKRRKTVAKSPKEEVKKQPKSSQRGNVKGAKKSKENPKKTKKKAPVKKKAIAKKKTNKKTKGKM